MPDFENWILGQTHDDLLVWLQSHRLALAKACQDALICGRPKTLRSEKLFCVELEWMGRGGKDRGAFEVKEIVLRSVDEAVSRYHLSPIYDPQASSRYKAALARPIMLGNSGYIVISVSCAPCSVLPD